MGRKNEWTPEEIAFLRENYREMSHLQMSLYLPPRTTKAVKDKCKILGFVTVRRRWTDEDNAYILEHYSNTNTKDLAEKFGCSLRAVYQHARNLGLNKSKEWIAQNARENLARRDHPARFTQFRKGQPSWNKGKKGLRFPGSEKGHFKAGHRPKNAVPVGTESVIDGYIKVKVAEPNVWKWKQRLIWEENFGEIPKGFAVIFKDKDRSNFSIENLEMISRKELRSRNHLSNLYTPEIRTAIRTLGSLKRKINRIIKKEKNNAEK